MFGRGKWEEDRIDDLERQLDALQGQVDILTDPRRSREPFIWIPTARRGEWTKACEGMPCEKKKIPISEALKMLAEAVGFEFTATKDTTGTVSITKKTKAKAK